MTDNPLVSVLMITYNHEKFIAQAIESVLMQHVNFKYEIVIGEDCSTDRTKNIVVDYQKKYSNRIKLLLQETNVGMHKNFIDTYYSCQGKYIALLEGDDYWTDPHKLQKQVDFLEANPEYVICFHPIKIWKEDEQQLVGDYITRNVPETTDIYELTKGNYIHTPSVLYRNGLIKNFPAEFYKSPAGDYFLHMLNAQFGKIKKLPDYMAVYRMHDKGVWAKNDSDVRIVKWLDVLTLLHSYFISQNKLEYAKLLEQQYIEQTQRLLCYYFTNKKSNKEILDAFNLIRKKIPGIIENNFLNIEKKKWEKENSFYTRLLRVVRRKLSWF